MWKYAPKGLDILDEEMRDLRDRHDDNQDQNDLADANLLRISCRDHHCAWDLSDEHGNTIWQHHDDNRGGDNDGSSLRRLYKVLLYRKKDAPGEERHEREVIEKAN